MDEFDRFVKIQGRIWGISPNSIFHDFRTISKKCKWVN